MEHYRTKKTGQVDELVRLVEELRKEKPKEAFIQQSMESLGWVYSKDPIERLDLVLKALHSLED